MDETTLRVNSAMSMVEFLVTLMPDRLAGDVLSCDGWSLPLTRESSTDVGVT